MEGERESRRDGEPGEWETGGREDRKTGRGEG